MSQSLYNNNVILSAVGSQVLLPPANYAVNDIEVNLWYAQSIAVGSLEIELLITSGDASPITYMKWSLSPVAAVNGYAPNIVSYRSFPSPLILLRGSNIQAVCTELFNTSVIKATVNMSGFILA